MPHFLDFVNRFQSNLLIFCEPEGMLFELKPTEKATVVLHEPFSSKEIELVYSLYENQFSITIWTKRATYSLHINEIKVF